MNKTIATNSGKFKINAIEWYVAHYTPSMQQQSILSEQILNKIPTQTQYPERSVFMKQVNTHKFWTFELGTQEGVNIPTWIFIAFQQNDRQHDKNLNNDTFVKLPVISAQVISGTQRYPAFLLIYGDDDYSQGYVQIKEAFKSLTKDDILQPYISDDNFRSSNEDNNVRYKIYAFVIRYQKDFENAQPLTVEIRFPENIIAGIYGYALVLTNKLISISSDGQRIFDLNLSNI